MGELNLTLPSPVHLVDLDCTRDTGVRLWLKRDDLIHPLVGGNKWRKLSKNLECARSLGKNKLLTFGGQHANHLLATAAAGQLMGMSTVGVVRGEQPREPYPPTLETARRFGMQLHFMSRTDYREKHHPDIIRLLRQKFGKDCYIIPEGGTNLAGAEGCREIVREFRMQHPEISNAVWCVPCGTGGTLSGIASELDAGSIVLGFAVLKGGFLEEEVQKLLPSSRTNWKIHHEFHFGGYARQSPELAEFIRFFKRKTDVQLDPVYTGKMMYGIVQLIQKSAFEPGTNLIAVHTGGIQGIAAFEKRYGVRIS